MNRSARSANNLLQRRTEHFVFDKFQKQCQKLKMKKKLIAKGRNYAELRSCYVFPPDYFYEDKEKGTSLRIKSICNVDERTQWLKEFLDLTISFINTSEGLCLRGTYSCVFEILSLVQASVILHILAAP
jgi:hypothetical protein